MRGWYIIAKEGKPYRWEMHFFPLTKGYCNNQKGFSSSKFPTKIVFLSSDSTRMEIDEFIDAYTDLWSDDVSLYIRIFGDLN